MSISPLGSVTARAFNVIAHGEHSNPDSGALCGSAAASSILVVADPNGKLAGNSSNGVPFRRSLIPAPANHIKAIYTEPDTGKVLGEMLVYGADDDAFKVIARDFYNLTHKIVLPT